MAPLIRFRPKPTLALFQLSYQQWGRTAATPSAGVSKFPLSAIREDRLRFQPLGHKIFRKSPPAREKTTNKEGPPCSHVGISSKRRAPDLRSPAPVSA